MIPMAPNRVSRLALLSVLLPAALFAELSPGARFAVAIEKDDRETIRILVEDEHQPVDTKIEYASAWTPLMKAAWEGRTIIAEYLIGKGANINYANADGETPLHQAIGREHVALVKLLLDKGAKADTADIRQFRPLHKAAAAGNVEIIQLLAAKKVDLNPEMYGLTPMMFAVSGKKPAAVQALIDAKANVNYASKSGNIGQTALFSAIQMGDAEMVKLLLAKGANPNAKTKAGDTPLKAAKNGDLDDIIALLTAAGAK